MKTLLGHTFSETKKLYQSGETARTIAVMYGCTRQYVSHFLRSNGFRMRIGGRTRPEYIQIIKFLKNKTPVEEIVSKLQTKKPYVQWVAHKNSLPLIYPSRHDVCLDSKEWLWKHYWRNGRSMEKIAQELGCTIGTVSKYLQQHKIPKKTSGDYNRKDYRFQPLFNNKKRFVALLKRKTIQQLASDLGCCINAVIKAKIRLGLL